MTVDSISQILSKMTKDDALIRHFLAIWPEIESILEAFSKATQLPIFVFLNEEHLFQTSLDTMPSFCRYMLGSGETASLCIADGLRRALGEVPDFQKGIQMCHAGMLNGRRQIELGFGRLTIFFGSKRSMTPEAASRREQVIQHVSAQNDLLAEQLQSVAGPDTNAAEFDPSDIALIDATTDIISHLIDATAGFRLLTINMAHELSMMMINLGLLTKATGDFFATYKENHEASELADKILEAHDTIYTQCRLGLFIVRNFLSHASETRYDEVSRPQFREIQLRELLDEVIKLHRLAAAEKKITLESHFADLPPVYGFDMELRRLFSNILNNAIKYSYHSVPNAKRIIRIKSKVPYDPGFKQTRFAITFENYGLGLTEEERRSVFKPGFRGKQAIAEVPIGSGIGLSEAAKIMKLHKGKMRLQSKELYHDDAGGRTYLTTVDLIFPYAPGRISR
jgi:signal transduction histidine kinase